MFVIVFAEEGEEDVEVDLWPFFAVVDNVVSGVIQNVAEEVFMVVGKNGESVVEVVVSDVGY